MCLTPGTAFALVASKLFTLPPKTGERATTATSKPGAFTSIPNCALPSTLGGVSSRFTRVPRIFQSFGSLSGTRSEEHTSELQSQSNLVCRLLLEKQNNAVVNS